MAAVWRSMLIAGSGLLYTLVHERNAQVESAIAVLVILAGLWLHVDRVEWALLLLCIILVLALENLNTAIEATVDLASPQQHPLARIAKDTAAGAVLLAAIGSVGVGVLIFLPRLWPLLIALWS